MIARNESRTSCSSQPERSRRPGVGSGQNIIHEGNGWNSPEIVDDSDAPRTGVYNSFQDGTGWTSGPAGTGFNGTEQIHAAAAGGTAATWTFANLTQNTYYDVYVTWSPEADASAAAQYVVSNGSGSIAPVGQTSIAPVNQTLAPADSQAAGTFWQDLGVFGTGASTTLTVQLSANMSGVVLADAVQLVKYAAAPTTNLIMNSFTADSGGNLWVNYTITGAAAPQFNIGVYSSTDGVQPQQLVQSVPTDSADLGPGKYTVPLGITLANLDSSGYFIAVLDPDDAVEETTKADNISAPITGSYQDDSGGVHVFTPSGSQADSVTATQDPSTGDITIVANGTTTVYQSVSAVYVALQGNGGTVNGAGVNLPMTIYGGAGTDTITGGSGSNTIYAGSGNDTIIGGSGNNEIYGGAGYDTLDGSAGQNNWIQAGSGGSLIKGGSGNDWLYGGSGATTINAGNGTEVIHGGSGTNHIYGGSGLDDIYGGAGTNFIYGKGENDILEGGTGGNYIYPNYGNNPGLASLKVKDHNNNPTFDGNINADGSPHSDANDYEAVDPANAPDPAYGGVWTFNPTASGARLGPSGSTPMVVYANWQPGGPNLQATDGYQGTQWATDAKYEIFDGGTLVGSVPEDQQTQPGNDSPVPNDRAWTRLGVWDISSGTLTVKLVDNGSPTGSVLCAGEVMIHPLWPTVSIRATNVTINSKVAPANAGEYVDWVDACQPIGIRAEGSGTRTKLQLTATIDQLFADLPNWNWTASLPLVSGLNFWDSPQDGSQWQPQSLTPGTSYNGDVWVSTDPKSPPMGALTINFVADPEAATVAAKVAVAEWKALPIAELTKTLSKTVKGYGTITAAPALPRKHLDEKDGPGVYLAFKPEKGAAVHVGWIVYKTRIEKNPADNKWYFTAPPQYDNAANPAPRGVFPDPRKDPQVIDPAKPPWYAGPGNPDWTTPPGHTEKAPLPQASIFDRPGPSAQDYVALLVVSTGAEKGKVLGTFIYQRLSDEDGTNHIYGQFFVPVQNFVQPFKQE